MSNRNDSNRVRQAQASIPSAPAQPTPADNEEDAILKSIVNRSFAVVAEKPHQSAPVINLNKSVKAINNGPRFPINLTGYGYGGAWPTKAVYTIPMGVFMDCCADGKNLVLVG
jgi:hypothetical protein